MNNLIFVGGIHGAGKNTVCVSVCKEMNLVHLTASEILKWTEISAVDNKKVDNIQETQNRLIEGLKNIITENKPYLLDGHFCLFNKKGDFEKIPMKTFEIISPKLIGVVTNKVKVILDRLSKRDNKEYEFNLLKRMQDSEIAYAKEIAMELQVPFVEIENGNAQVLIKAM